MKLFVILIFLFVNSICCSQTILNENAKENTSFSINLGSSAGLMSKFKKTAFIPSAGLDINFGTFGFRASGQVFDIKPDFDMAAYLKPITSEITQSNLKEKNSNVLLGVSPYLSFGEQSVSVQAGLGLKYLLQKSATTKAVYKPNPSIVMLNFPESGKKQTALLLEPNIRVTIGKRDNPIRFFFESTYSLPLSKTDFNYTSRGDLTALIDPKSGLLIRDRVQTSKPVMNTGKPISDFITAGLGIEINFSAFAKPSANMPSVNNYGINDEGIKRTLPENELSEIKPLLLIGKGAERPTRKPDVVEFSWQALNAEECGQLQYEFLLTEDQDEKAANTDLQGKEVQGKALVVKMLTIKDYSIKANNIITYAVTKKDVPALFEKGRLFTWEVRALDANGNFPPCAWGGNNTIMSTYSSYDCGIQVIIDTVYCSPRPPQQGFINYELKFRIKNISSSSCPTNHPALFTGNTPYPSGSNIKITDINNQPISQLTFTPQNPLVGASLAIGQTSSQYSVTISIPTSSSISDIRLHAWPTYSVDPAYGAAYDTKKLSACGCTFCQSVQININTPQPPQPISQTGYDAVYFPLSISYSPYKVNRIVAEVVAFEHMVNNSSCITCNNDNRMHGVFVGSAQNTISGSGWINSGHASLYPAPTNFSREATWSTTNTSGMLLNNQSLNLNLGVPVRNPLSCCQDRLRWTIRFSFISLDEVTGECRVCETTRTYCLVRKGNIVPPNLRCRDIIDLGELQAEPINIPPIKNK